MTSRRVPRLPCLSPFSRIVKPVDVMSEGASSQEVAKSSLRRVVQSINFSSMPFPIDIAYRGLGK
jgi:hypothetical protein